MSKYFISPFLEKFLIKNNTKVQNVLLLSKFNNNYDKINRIRKHFTFSDLYYFNRKTHESYS